MATPDALPVEKAAEELGVPVDALRLYLAAHEAADPSKVSISRVQVDALTAELKARAGELRLDDLAKTALTIKWLANSAVEAAHDSRDIRKEIERLDTDVKSAQAVPDVEALVRPIHDRVVHLEAEASKSGGQSSMQMVGSLQTMIEAQGREMDKLRAEQEDLKKELASVMDSHRRLGEALMAAFGVSRPPDISSGKDKAQTPVAQPAPVGQPEPEPKFTNTPVTTPVRVGVKREIEYNFLMERMGYRRLDSYSTEELAAGETPVPSDEEISAFLAKYETGGDPELVEILTVHRGEYQMVQYQRVDQPSAGGLRGWIPQKRK